MTDLNNSVENIKDYFALDENSSAILFDTAKVLTVYVQPCLCIIGLLGNVLSLIIFLSKDLRKVSSNIYLSALSASCSMFLLALFLVWLEVVQIRLIHRHVWCQGIVFVSYVSSFLTVWFIVCITVENYIVTFHLRKATYFCTVFKAKIVVLCLTVTSFTLFVFAFWSTRVENFMGVYVCTESVEHRQMTTIFTYIDTIVTLILPTVVLFVLISAILAKHIWQRHKHSKLPINSGSTRQRLSKKEKSLLKITRVLLAIGLAYVILSLPSYVNKVSFIISQSFNPVAVTMNERARNQIFQIIFYSTFSLNCFFYFKWSLNFRRGLKRLFYIRCSKKDKHEQTLLALTHGQASAHTERTNAARNTVTSI